MAIQVSAWLDGRGMTDLFLGASLTDVVCHPTMSLAIAAMNDGTMRIYDLKTGKPPSCSSTPTN